MNAEGSIDAGNLLSVEFINELFTYHAPTGDQPERYGKVRDAAKQLAIVIAATCPPSPDRSAAIRKVREAVMTANASIALEPRMVGSER